MGGEREDRSMKQWLGKKELIIEVIIKRRSRQYETEEDWGIESETSECGCLELNELCLS